MLLNNPWDEVSGIIEYDAIHDQLSVRIPPEPLYYRLRLGDYLTIFIQKEKKKYIYIYFSPFLLGGLPLYGVYDSFVEFIPFNEEVSIE